jgi:hypothetical protein
VEQLEDVEVPQGIGSKITEVKKHKSFFICLMAACADTFLSICRLNDGIQFHCD